jgi:hypothetical protein
MTLDSTKIKNFKAVRDSGAVKLGPLGRSRLAGTAAGAREK